jgi:hypothetical protein
MRAEEGCVLSHPIHQEGGLSELQLELAEHLRAGKSLADAALACQVSRDTARRAFEDFHAGNLPRASNTRPEFASGLALCLYDAGFLVCDPSDGKDWDALLECMRRFLRRHGLVPPGAYVPHAPGSSRFSRTEQAAMVSQYLRARAEGRSTTHIGELFLRWGITAAMMDKWRQRYLGAANPHAQDSRAEKQRQAVLSALPAPTSEPVTSGQLQRRAQEAGCPMSDPMLRNRMRELCRKGLAVSVRLGKRHLGYTGT